MRYCGEDVGHVSRGPLDAILVIDLALSGLKVNIKQIKVVVEINISSTQIPVMW